MHQRDRSTNLFTHLFPEVLGDEKERALVFQNLLSNALKYRREDVRPKIEILTESRAGEIVTSVRDKGIGFPPVHSERISGLFGHLHKDAHPGTGAGVALPGELPSGTEEKIWDTCEGEGLGATFPFSAPAPNL